MIAAWSGCLSIQPTPWRKYSCNHSWVSSFTSSSFCGLRSSCGLLSWTFLFFLLRLSNYLVCYAWVLNILRARHWALIDLRSAQLWLYLRLCSSGGEQWRYIFFFHKFELESVWILAITPNLNSDDMLIFLQFEPFLFVSSLTLLCLYVFNIISIKSIYNSNRTFWIELTTFWCLLLFSVRI